MYYDVISRPRYHGFDGYGTPVTSAIDYPAISSGIMSPGIAPPPTVTPTFLPGVSAYTNVVAPAPAYVAESWDSSQHWSAGADGFMPADAYQSDLMVKKSRMKDAYRKMQQQQQQQNSGTPWLLVALMGGLGYFVGSRKK